MRGRRSRRPTGIRILAVGQFVVAIEPYAIGLIWPDPCLIAEAWRLIADPKSGKVAPRGRDCGDLGGIASRSGCDQSVRRNGTTREAADFLIGIVEVLIADESRKACS